MPTQFPILADKKRFPLLSSFSEACNHALMTCDDLQFFAPEDASAANFATRKPGFDWHLYGDTRWPSSAAWVEFPLTHHSFLDHGGVLVVRAKLPPKVAQSFDWIAANHPLGHILPAMRSGSMIKTISEMLQSQAHSNGRMINVLPTYKATASINRRLEKTMFALSLHTPTFSTQLEL